MESKRTTVRDLRRHNRSALLSKLFFDGPLSRHELSSLTSLSAATVSNVTGELIDERLIVEAGLIDSDGGRPRVLLRVDPRYGHVVGVDVGETGVKVELFDLAMTALATVEHPLPSVRPEPVAVVEQVASGLRDVLAEAGVDGSSVIGVGIGLPGAVEQGAEAIGNGESVRVHAPTIGWDGVPLGTMLRESGITLPLFFDNGAKTLGPGRDVVRRRQRRRARGDRADRFRCRRRGRRRRNTYRGATSSAGEWGHTVISYGGRPCRCGSRGCLEAYVGAEGILDRYRQARGGRVVGA